MSKREDIKRVLIIGSGPIVIGQACEFDYSGTQACKALMAQGLEVILVNSNPATIMTDPEIATRIYVEPLKVSFLERILEKERPDSLIPTLGGQTALNLALELDERGILDQYGVQLLGANPQVIRAAEDREIFRSILDRVGAKYPKSEMVRSFEEGLLTAERLGFPLILRPNYTLGGGGGGIAYSGEEYKKILAQALSQSPSSEVLVEESILGWKEFELEVMRDHKGTFVVVCTIENFDPCGVHTGDSITVAPQQTLSDREYQAMRDEAYRILNEVGVQTGGANIQFAVHPSTGERFVIEMNPRVSRSSALASKATGFPIAKIAALLAIGYTLDEIPNDITKTTLSCYEPALDYVVTKIPRFAFEKFQGAKDFLSTQMKSVGEVMGIGRTLQESLMKAVLSLEFHAEGFPFPASSADMVRPDQISYPNSKRLFHIYQAFRDGYTVEEIHQLTQITPYFLEQLQDLVRFENVIKELGGLLPFSGDSFGDMSEDSLQSKIFQVLLGAKRRGFSDALIGRLLREGGSDSIVESNLGDEALAHLEQEVRRVRRLLGIEPSYFQVDTCAGEFQSETPYFYSTYWTDPLERKHFFGLENPVAIIGSGSNRIGQGIEFDYGCVRGAWALQKWNHQVVMINSNPETVSTDYDTSDALFFEPLTEEHVDEVLRYTKVYGFIAQLGGQTPIRLVNHLVREKKGPDGTSIPGHCLLGSSLETIDLAEDRGLFSEICQELRLQIPRSAMVYEIEGALHQAELIGYPLICRPSYVLGGRRMEVVESAEELESYFLRHGFFFSNQRPCLMDQFLEGALEVDVDLVRGRDWLVVGGVVEHIEAAGVHSGDSMGVLPPQRLRRDISDHIEALSRRLADRLGVIGFLNLQLAVREDEVFILEANPRSSRSVPFISKATGIPLVDLGIAALLGKTKDEVRPEQYKWRAVDKVSVKGVVFPFRRFPESDSILGPEMKSTGESMGRASNYPEALMKAFLSSQFQFPHSGEVFFSLRDADKESLLPVAQTLHDMGYTLSATGGSAQFFNDHGIPTQRLRKVHEGRPHCVDHIRQGKVVLVINTTSGRVSIEASLDIRRACVEFGIPCITEGGAARSFVVALGVARDGKIQVGALRN